MASCRHPASGSNRYPSLHISKTLFGISFHSIPFYRFTLLLQVNNMNFFGGGQPQPQGPDPVFAGTSMLLLLSEIPTNKRGDMYWTPDRMQVVGAIGSLPQNCVHSPMPPLDSHHSLSTTKKTKYSYIQPRRKWKCIPTCSIRFPRPVTENVPHESMPIKI